MATTTDDGFHEIHLNGKQLVFLFMAVTVVSVVIFLFGVLVGRGVRASSPGDAIAELAAGAAPPVPDPALAAPTTPGGAPVSAGEPLSYPDRLSGSAPVPEKLREGGDPPKPAPAPAAEKPAPAKPAAEKPADKPAAKPAEKPADKPAAAKPEPTPAPAAAKPADKPAPAAAVSGEPAGSGFAIQVAALRERSEAESVARRLSGKGYAAYVLAPSAGTPRMYRVRVGKFKERREADAVAAKLQKEEQFKPWIVR